MSRNIEDEPIFPEWPYVAAGGVAGVVALTLLSLVIGPKPATVLVYPFLFGFAFLGFKLAPKREAEKGRRP